MTLESIEKLRNLRDEAASKMVDNPRWVCARAEEIADEIEREIAEKYMELPVDADGVPIHLGDMVEGELLFDNATVKGTVTTYHIHDDDEPGTVYVRVKPTEDTWTIKELRFTRCRHVKPRTVEDVLVEFYGKFAKAKYGEDSEVLSHYADEIRELLGERKMQ